MEDGVRSDLFAAGPWRLVAEEVAEQPGVALMRFALLLRDALDAPSARRANAELRATMRARPFKL